MTALASLIGEMEKWPYAATPYIIKKAKDSLKVDKQQKEKIVSYTIDKIKKEMDTDKMHQRVLEIQKNIEGASPDQQTKMMGELLSMVSQIEQSLADIKIDIDEIQNDE